MDGLNSVNFITLLCGVFMVHCAKFAGRSISSCTRGNACICHDYIEDCDCSECKTERIRILKKKIENPWLDIEFAPETPGSVAIIYAPSEINSEGTVGEAFLADDFQWYWSGCDAQYHDPIAECNSPPTHWMPLPKPPSNNT